MGICGAAQNAGEGGRRRAGGLSGEPEELGASPRLTCTLLTLRLQRRFVGCGAKADALGKKIIGSLCRRVSPKLLYRKSDSSHLETNGFYLVSTPLIGAELEKVTK